uniref:Uncharacterized protein n=1 Tax=Gopherus evgoodei TaxID=1825980 RepID=A0A8C4VJ51_9SAUR
MVPNIHSALPVTGTKPRTSWPRKALLILGFLFALAAIALVAMAVSQNKPLPKNIKVL